MDVDGRQVLHLLLGDVEPDAVVDAGDRADRDGHFLASPQMPLLEEHMGHMVVSRVDDQALDPPDIAVGGVDVLVPAHGHLAQRDLVLGDDLRRGSADQAGAAACTDIADDAHAAA
jgi:hypothetical protein